MHKLLPVTAPSIGDSNLRWSKLNTVKTYDMVRLSTPYNSKTNLALFQTGATWPQYDTNATIWTDGIFYQRPALSFIRYYNKYCNTAYYKEDLWLKMQ